jgi:hypothetical protein
MILSSVWLKNFLCLPEQGRAILRLHRGVGASKLSRFAGV